MRLVRFVHSFLLALLLASGAQAQPQAPAAAWPTHGWEVATPESQGMDSAALLALLDFGAANGVDSVVVTRHGRMVLEAYYAPFAAGNLHAVNSATKAVVGALAGIAIRQGLLPGAATPLAELFPQVAVGADARKRAVTLQHLLDMTSGLDWTEPLSRALPETMLEMTRSRDWVRFIVDRPMAQAPGAGFNYNSGNSHLVSAVLASTAGMSTEAFAARHLFAPLGITHWRWNRDPTGVTIGGWGLSLSTPDMARIGLLYLHRGSWDGREVVPRDWVDKVYRAAVPMDLAPGADFRYGDGWWTLPARQALLAVGFNRQLVVVLPQQGVVAALTGRRNYPLAPMLDLLQHGVRAPGPLPEDATAAAALAARVRALASPPAAAPDAAAAPGR